MPKQIFVNLPVADVRRSTAFFTALGLAFNSHFTDENAGCLQLEDNIFVMLLPHDRFAKYTREDSVDSSAATEVALTLRVESREAVDALVGKALHSGGSAFNEAKEQDSTYSRSFQDPDRHLWEVVYMGEPQQLARADASLEREDADPVTGVPLIG